MCFADQVYYKSKALWSKGSAVVARFSKGGCRQINVRSVNYEDEFGWL